MSKRGDTGIVVLLSQAPSHDKHKSLECLTTQAFTPLGGM
nr:MAG TPA: hypothetical protein [Caudoviricetes sp.]